MCSVLGSPEFTLSISEMATGGAGATSSSLAEGKGTNTKMLPHFKPKAKPYFLFHYI